MPSISGSQEPQPHECCGGSRSSDAHRLDCRQHIRNRPVSQPHEPILIGSLTEVVDIVRKQAADRAAGRGLTDDERDRIADGEPYCFRCGKPASSFSEYCENYEHGDEPPHPDAVAYVKSEEGTYNPETNRFACDECYIAIGMPAGPDGWKAP